MGFIKTVVFALIVGLILAAIFVPAMQSAFDFARQFAG